MQLLSHTKFVVQYSDFEDKKDKKTDFPHLMTKNLAWIWFTIWVVCCQLHKLSCTSTLRCGPHLLLLPVWGWYIYCGYIINEIWEPVVWCHSPPSTSLYCLPHTNSPWRYWPLCCCHYILLLPHLKTSLPFWLVLYI